MATTVTCDGSGHSEGKAPQAQLIVKTTSKAGSMVTVARSKDCCRADDCIQELVRDALTFGVRAANAKTGGTFYKIEIEKI